jgi:pimeloyl-ACP methyl ester carboxylesterase
MVAAISPDWARATGSRLRVDGDPFGGFDIYLADLRGVGRSTQPRCPRTEALEGASYEELAQRCGEELRARFGDRDASVP